jgi:uncharacterized membrane protein YkvA (DUF1232 family)
MPAKKTARKGVAANKAATKQPANKSTPKTGPATAKKTAIKRSSAATTKADPTVPAGKIEASASFTRARSKAEAYAKDPKKLGKLFEDAAAKAKTSPKGPFGETWAYFQAMIRLVRAYANGSYREIPTGSLLLILVAVIYFVSPIDFIPDAIPGVGLIDDALVVTLTVKQVKADLDDFMAWEMAQA